MLRRTLLTMPFVGTAARFAHAGVTWGPKHDRGNRYEGIIEIPRSASSSVVQRSFTAYRESIDDAGAELKISFYAPEVAGYVAEARELREDKQYYMQFKPERAEAKQIKTFSSWPTVDVLEKEGIKVDQLGVLVRRDGAALSDTLIPAMVWWRQQPKWDVQAPEYELHLYTSRSWREFSCEVIQNGDEGEKVNDAPKRLIAQDTVRLKLPNPKKAGEAQVVLRAESMNAGEPLFKEFTFLHRSKL